MIFLISINIFIIFKPQTVLAAYYVIWSKDNNTFDCVSGSKVSEQNPPLSDSYATLDFCKTEITTIEKLGFCIADQKIGSGKTCRPYFTHQKLDNMFKECDSPLQKFSTLQECQDVLNPQPKEAEIKWQPVVPTFQIKIPNMKEYTNTDIEELKKTEKTDEGEFVFIPFLARYISDIYRWALLIAGFVLLVMILIGGFIYMTSAGNAERAKAGKDRIASAVLGFCLLLISYSLLYIINPELVGLKSLKIKIIPRNELEEPGNELVNPTGQIFEGASTFGANGVPDLKQCDAKWGNTIYGDNSSCTTICKGGCGITSLADVLNYYGYKISPIETANFSVSVGARPCNKGTAGPTLCNNVSKKWPDLTCRSIKPSNVAEIVQLLRDKKPIIFSCHSCVGTTATGQISYKGHFMVLTGVDGTGTFFSVNDPGRQQGMIKISNAEFLTPRIAAAYIVEKKGGNKTPAQNTDPNAMGNCLVAGTLVENVIKSTCDEQNGEWTAK